MWWKGMEKADGIPEAQRSQVLGHQPTLSAPGLWAGRPAARTRVAGARACPPRRSLGAPSALQLGSAETLLPAQTCWCLATPLQEGPALLGKPLPSPPLPESSAPAAPRPARALTFNGQAVDSPPDGGLGLSFRLAQQDDTGPGAVHTALWLLHPARGLWEQRQRGPSGVSPRLGGPQTSRPALPRRSSRWQTRQGFRAVCGVPCTCAGVRVLVFECTCACT